MKSEEMQIKTYTGIRLWIAQFRERKHVERVSRPVVILGNLKIG